MSLVGTWMQSMAVGWLALTLSDSAFIVGLVVACSALPIVLFSLPAGVLVDRMDKLRLVAITQALLLADAALLWWFTYSGHMSIPWLLALAVFGGTVSSVEIPARQSLMVELVGKEDLRDAIALNSSGFNLARIVGPAIAAAILARWGLAWCFAVNGMSFLAVLVGISQIERPQVEDGVEMSPQESPYASIKGGLRYVLGHPVLRGLVELVAVFSILGTPVLALLPVMTRDQLHLGPGGYGLMLSAIGIGGLCGALALASSSPRLPKGKVLLRGQYACAAVMLLLACTGRAALAYPLFLALGFFFIVNSALGNTIMQAVVPDAYRGRLMAIYSLVVVGVPQVVGAFAAGAVARLTSVGWTVGGSAVLMLLYSYWAFRRYPAVREA